VNDLIINLSAFVRALAVSTRHRLRDDRGEGVISTGLAVLIVAFLGVAAYALFKTLLDDSGNAARTHIKSYGGN
jgi:hypothetical protein